MMKWREKKNTTKYGQWTIYRSAWQTPFGRVHGKTTIEQMATVNFGGGGGGNKIGAEITTHTHTHTHTRFFKVYNFNKLGKTAFKIGTHTKHTHTNTAPTLQHALTKLDTVTMKPDAPHAKITRLQQLQCLYNMIISHLTHYEDTVYHIWRQRCKATISSTNHTWYVGNKTWLKKSIRHSGNISQNALVLIVR